MAKGTSRPTRWANAVSTAQEAFGALQEALSELQDLRDEYEDWKENLPENLQQGELAEKLDAVVDLDFETPKDEIGQLLGEAENIDLPLGFGRD